MRRIKRINGYFTLEKGGRAEETDQLCDQCGNSECSIRMIVNRVKINRFNAKLAVIRCEAFIPSLDFRDTAGMGSEFNTFRLGAAWAKRVQPGDLVNLRDTSGNVVGVAEVTAVDYGAFPEMDKLHSVDNHLAIDAELQGKDFCMEKTMTEVYGGHRFNAQSTVSVISLRRIDGTGEEGQAHLRRVS